jgi:hypothetical protein
MSGRSSEATSEEQEVVRGERREESQEREKKGRSGMTCKREEAEGWCCKSPELPNPP